MRRQQAGPMSSTYNANQKPKTTHVIDPSFLIPVNKQSTYLDKQEKDFVNNPTGKDKDKEKLHLMTTSVSEAKSTSFTSKPTTLTSPTNSKFPPKLVKTSTSSGFLKLDKARLEQVEKEDNPNSPEEK